MVNIEQQEQSVLRFVKMTENAYAPSKATPDAAGFDLYRYFSHIQLVYF
jgi:hypothetical protein